jgi:5'-3' exonuclease
MATKIEELNPLIDCDIITYRVGFACNDENEPIEFCLHSVKKVIQGILEKFSEREYHKLFLTGKDNFRDKVATMQPYKGNRKDTPKPIYYEEIRQYMIDVWGAEVIEGMEADDAMGIGQWAAKDKSTCIVTMDKDLNMIPGWHWNWVKGGDPNYIRLPEADRFFWFQMLTGDSTDNIPGIPRVGPKTAEKILAKGNNHREIVMEEYKKYYRDKAEMAFDEVAKLLWILREEGKTYSDYV